MGDLNITKNNYKEGIPATKKKSEWNLIQELMKKFDLVDLRSVLYTEKVLYIWQSHIEKLKAELDHYLVSRNNLHRFTDIDMCVGNTSDLLQFWATFKLKKYKRPSKNPEIWKMNISWLNDEVLTK
ncbi:hypothetical protein AYI69_g11309 [Smittium culicis]|uniref:Endonuclease/exonuclease/phosphatase domain-containing protein n=1 Tax=Smittium culicis TaxID=133412 RepID=A0A1R1WZM2_9FUNG|nr:hypothetical protein AYI69_g11309 [Smittium culicis]